MKSRLMVSVLQNGLTQKEIAERVGTSQPHISNWLSGITMPNTKNLKKLCEVIDKTPYEYYCMVEIIKR